MAETTQSPGAAPPDVSRQIAELTDAVNRLVQAQRAPAPSSTSHPTTTTIAPDIGGAIPGGSTLSPSVDVSKLSPLQQITLGLRDAKPVGPAHRETVAHAQAQPARETDDGAAPAGAD